MISNTIVVYALYLTDIALFVKIFIGIAAFILNYKNLLKNNFITAFYLTTQTNKSLLLTKYNKQIKVNFIEVSYFNSLLIVLRFANKLKTFRVLVVRGQIGEELFKSLIILARYHFLPEVHTW